MDDKKVCEAWEPGHPENGPLYYVGHIDGKAVYACPLHVDDVAELTEEDADRED